MREEQRAQKPADADEEVGSEGALRDGEEQLVDSDEVVDLRDNG